MKLSEFKEEQVEEKYSDIKSSLQDKSVEDLFNTYKDMDQSQLMNTLLQEVSKQKQQGTFDINKLEQTLSQVMPFLNDGQKNNLLTILQKLK